MINIDHKSLKIAQFGSLITAILLIISLLYINNASALASSQPNISSGAVEPVPIPATSTNVNQFVPASNRLDLSIKPAIKKIPAAKDASVAAVTEPAAASSAAQPEENLPSRLIIPDISVDTAVGYVGLDPDGAMYIDGNEDNAVWYELGARPGEIGSAVMAGHFERKNGRTSVFDDLYKLQIGDKIYVTAQNGSTIVFVVRETRIIDRLADASDIFSSQDGLAHLNIITCNGNWDENTKTYDRRLIVFADRE